MLREVEVYRKSLEPYPDGFFASGTKGAGTIADLRTYIGHQTDQPPSDIYQIAQTAISQAQTVNGRATHMLAVDKPGSSLSDRGDSAREFATHLDQVVIPELTRAIQTCYENMKQLAEASGSVA